MIAPLGVLRDRDCQPGVAVHFWSVSLVTLARSLCPPRALESQIVQHTAARIFAPGLIRLLRFCIAAFLYSSKPRLKSCMSLGFWRKRQRLQQHEFGPVPLWYGFSRIFTTFLFPERQSGSSAFVLEQFESAWCTSSRFLCGHAWVNHSVHPQNRLRLRHCVTQSDAGAHSKNPVIEILPVLSRVWLRCYAKLCLKCWKAQNCTKSGKFHQFIVAFHDLFVPWEAVRLKCCRFGTVWVGMMYLK